MKKSVIVMACILFLSIVGCGASNLETSDLPDEKSVIEIQDHSQALEVLLQEFKDTSDTNEYKVSLLREAELGQMRVYAFERVGLNGGAANTFFVTSQGQVFDNSSDLLLTHFQKSADKKQYSDGRYLNTDLYCVEMVSVNDPEVITWSSYIVNEKAYSDLDKALGAVVTDFIANDPLLSLLGKDLPYVEKATGQKAQKIVISDLDGIEDMTSEEIIYKGAKISFFTGNTASDIFYQDGQELLGVKIGDKFTEIMSVLGSPETLIPDPYFADVYTMTYNLFGQLHIEFYAESEEGPTVSALVKAI